MFCLEKWPNVRYTQPVGIWWPLFGNYMKNPAYKYKFPPEILTLDGVFLVPTEKGTRLATMKDMENSMFKNEKGNPLPAASFRRTGVTFERHVEIARSFFKEFAKVAKDYFHKKHLEKQATEWRRVMKPQTPAVFTPVLSSLAQDKTDTSAVSSDGFIQVGKRVWSKKILAAAQFVPSVKKNAWADLVASSSDDDEDSSTAAAPAAASSEALNDASWNDLLPGDKEEWGFKNENPQRMATVETQTNDIPGLISLADLFGQWREERARATKNAAITKRLKELERREGNT